MSAVAAAASAAAARAAKSAANSPFLIACLLRSAGSLTRRCRRLFPGRRYLLYKPRGLAAPKWRPFCDLTKPMTSYIRSSVGSDSLRAFSAPTASSRCSSRSSARSASYRCADRIEQRDDRLADVLLELAVAGAVVARLDLRDRLAGRDRHDLDQVRHARLLGSRSCRTSRPESVTADLNFLRITSGGSTISTVPCAVPPVVDILFCGSCRSMIRAPSSG